METPQGLTLDVQSSETGPVVHVIGEVDIHTAPALRECVHEQLSQATNGLTIDLSGTEFMDSTGLGVLVGAAKEIQQGAGGRITLARPSKTVRKLLAITGVEELFDIVEGDPDTG